MADSVKVFAPASVGNSCVGFDVLGFAVEKPGDELLLRKSKKPGITIKSISGDHGKLSTDPAKNTATIAIDAFLKEYGNEIGLEIELYKKMPFGSGLGSSAASAVAGAFAANCSDNLTLLRKSSSLPWKENFLPAVHIMPTMLPPAFMVA